MSFVGLDVGKSDHHAVAVTAAGKTVYDKALPNDEARLRAILDDLATAHGPVLMVVDQPATIGALPVAVAQAMESVTVAYLPGLAMRRIADLHPGTAKTDARDAHVIADQARMRPNLEELIAEEGELAELEILLARRKDLVTDQTRSINRLRDALLSSFPALERALDLTRRGTLILVSNYQTPAAIRRMGRKRLTDFLKKRGVKGAEALAGKAITAAKSQSVTLPAEEVSARIVAELAGEVLSLKQSIEALERTRTGAALLLQPLAHRPCCWGDNRRGVLG